MINFLDEERFLTQAIESVIAQTLAEWELLLVDDGSKDGSTEIAREASRRHPESVRYLEHPQHANLGTSAARNLGIRHARGEFVAFLDADDVWFPHKLERQLARLREHPEVGMVYGTSQLWHSWTGDPLDAGRDLTPDLGVPLDQPLEGKGFLARLLRREALSPLMCSILLSRKTAVEVGGFEESFRGMYDDQAFVAKVALSKPLLASGECWDRYRQRPDSCYAVARSTGQAESARLVFLEWLALYLRERGRDDRHLRKVLAEEIESARLKTRRGVVDRARRRLRRALDASSPPARGRVDFGSLRRLTPVSRRWGKDRGGTPIDRHYIEGFLRRHAAAVRGRVLEVGDDAYTRKFGGSAVERSDVLHPRPGQPGATLVADLAGEPTGLPATAFDCVILTQVLQMIRDPGAAVRAVSGMLRPGGVLLATVPGISQVSRWDMVRWGDYWRFTSLSARRVFEASFPPELVSVEIHGNVLAASAFLYGLAAEELTREELDHQDLDYPVLIAVRAERPLEDGSS